MNKTVIFAILIPLMALLLTCRKLPENPPLLYYEYQSPQVTGIIITHAEGPQELGRWGTIEYPENNEQPNPGGLSVYNPYPNPNLSPMIIPFYLSQDAAVSVYIVSATGPGGLEDNLIFNNMSWYIKPTGKPVAFTGVNVDRVVDGRIVEHGGAANMLMPLLEIGAIKVVGSGE